MLNGISIYFIKHGIPLKCINKFSFVKMWNKLDMIYSYDICYLNNKYFISSYYYKYRV